jgi:hypothetical protein
MTDDLVKRLYSLHSYENGVEDLAEDAARTIELLTKALRPFAKLFLYPDDLGLEASMDIKEDLDWDDDANDMQMENCSVLRRNIKDARAALEQAAWYDTSLELK